MAENRFKQKTIYKWTIYLAIIALIALIFGFILAFWLKKSAILPFTVVIDGIIIFFGVLIISNALSNSNPLSTGEMRKAITVSVVVVYFGLLPIFTLKGLLNLEVGSQTVATALNQTSVPEIAFQDSVIGEFTTLVGAVILFYFGSRTIENYWKYKNGKKDESADNQKTTVNPPPNAGIATRQTDNSPQNPPENN